MTLGEMMEEIVAKLEIEIADGELPEEDLNLLLKCQEEVNKEIAEKGYFESRLDMNMSVEEFVALCLRNRKHS